MLNDDEVKRLADLKWRQAVMNKAGQFDTVWDDEIQRLEAKAEEKPKPKVQESSGDDSEVNNGT